MTDAWAAIIVALASMIGTGLGGWAAVRAANRLTNYRIEQLEKKMDKHNGLMEWKIDANARICALEKEHEHAE
mgnify:CR=1 FL=1